MCLRSEHRGAPHLNNARDFVCLFFTFLRSVLYSSSQGHKLSWGFFGAASKFHYAGTQSQFFFPLILQPTHGFPQKALAELGKKIAPALGAKLAAAQCGWE